MVILFNIQAIISYILSNKVASSEYIFRVNSLFHTFDNIESCFSNTPRHKFLPEFAYSVMMGDASSIFHDLISCGVLDVTVTFQGVFEALNSESEVNVDNCSCVIDLNKLLNT